MSSAAPSHREARYLSFSHESVRDEALFRASGTTLSGTLVGAIPVGAIPNKAGLTNAEIALTDGLSADNDPTEFQIGDIEQFFHSVNDLPLAASHLEAAEFLRLPVPSPAAERSRFKGLFRTDTVEQANGAWVSGDDASETSAAGISEYAKESSFYAFIKRGFDLVTATLLLAVLSPIMVTVALLIRLTSPGPVIYRQDRLTAGNRRFTMYKFRTMRQDAEHGIGAVWAAKRDPRVTAIGEFLRSTRLDELPQLWNVLRGEMSLIGPRPERPEIAQKLAEELPSFRCRVAVKAGITGLAQVSEGYAYNLDSYRRKIALDRIYIRRRCLLLDLKIALKTVLVVITRSGAR